MKLEIIHPSHVQQAAKLIDEQGIPKDNVYSQYYVVVEGQEYPFKHLIRTAYMMASDQRLVFESNESYRNYIEGLGFKITYYLGGYNFFTKAELGFYKRIAKTEYRKDNPDQIYYAQKLYPIIAKAKYWAEQVLPPNFKLRQDGHWVSTFNARVKPYFWPRIFSGEDHDIFFNVEVNGADEGGFIGYKLDGYYSTTKALPPYKIDILNNYKKSIAWEWPKIHFEEIDQYNWEKLIAETKTYIQKYLHHHDHLKKVLAKERKMARITWNTNGWVRPSGRAGKSTNPSFEYENGFGHEEWLFDGDKIIDGYKYGFLEPIHKHRSTYEGNVFDLSLFTRDGATNASFWVTNLNDVEVLSPAISEEVLEHYKKAGWYDEMKADLFNLNLDSDQLDVWIANGAEQLFNVRFKATQLNDIPANLIPIADQNEIRSTRYTLMDVPSQVMERIQLELKKGFSFNDSGSEEAELSTSSSRTSQCKEIELELKHNRMQIKFLKYLQSKYGKGTVKRECTAFGASRIDIVRETESGYIFYEIKTYNSLVTSFREGIGQLLEYCLYPNVKEAKQIVLVSHVAPTDEVKEYLLHIKNFINIPFSYIHFDADMQEIVSEI